MSTVSITEIERNPGAFLARARAGEVVLITENDRPVAELKGVEGTAPNHVEEYLSNRISAAKTPSAWIEERVLEPSGPCRDLAFSVASELYAERGLIPHRIAASKVGGIFMAYQRPDGKRTLGVEVDNDLDAVGVVSNETDVLASSAFDGAEAEELLRVFYG